MASNYQRKLARYGLDPEDEQHDPTAQDLWDLARALKFFVSDNGQPNKVSTKSLFAQYGAPVPNISNAIGANDYQRSMLWRQLGELKGFGSCPTYKDGWFYV